MGLYQDGWCITEFMGHPTQIAVTMAIEKIICERVKISSPKAWYIAAKGPPEVSPSLGLLPSPRLPPSGIQWLWIYTSKPSRYESWAVRQHRTLEEWQD